MIKKFIRTVVSLVLCVSLFVTPVGVFAEAYGEEVTPAPVEFTVDTPTSPERENFRGSTPYKPFSFFFETITPTMEATARGIYETFIAAPVELFDWTEEGMMESVWMESEDELQYVANLARELTADCETTDEIIYELAKYLAQNIGYDYDYYYHETHGYPPIDPYTVLQNGYTVCSGYARTYETMLQSLGIPCVYVYSPDHEWSLVHNGERWMLIDVTWMSRSTYEYGTLNKDEKMNEEWFDFTIDTALSNYNHVIEALPLCLADGELKAYPIYSELPTIYWPEGVEKISAWLFGWNENLAGELKIPGTVTHIGDAAFYGCSGFTGELVLPDGLCEIGEWAFANCLGFEGSLVLPDTLKNVGAYAFAYNVFDGTLDLGDGVEKIGEKAFTSTETYRGDLIIPDSTKEIGAHAFSYTGFDGVMKLGENLEKIGEFAFYACESLKGDLVIPDSVKEIGTCTFSFLGIDGDIVIGDGLTTIPKEAFRAIQYSYGDIYISASVREIGENAFSYTHRMKNVYFKGDAPSVIRAGFDSSSFGPGVVTLHCTTTASGWTDSENYDAGAKTWMGYPLGTWEYVPDDATFAISGSVVSYNPKNPVTVTLFEDGEAVSTYTIGATDGWGETQGEFIIEDVKVGTYDLVVTKTSHLSYTIKGIKVESSSVELAGEIALIAGDVNGDGCVDLSDVVYLTSSTTYGRAWDEALNKSADIDGNECFDLSDLTVITSESAYNKSAVVVEYEG